MKTVIRKKKQKKKTCDNESHEKTHDRHIDFCTKYVITTFAGWEIIANDVLKIRKVTKFGTS